MWLCWWQSRVYMVHKHGPQSWPHQLGKSVTGQSTNFHFTFTNPLEGARKSYNIDRNVHPKESVCLVLTARLGIRSHSKLLPKRRLDQSQHKNSFSGRMWSRMHWAAGNKEAVLSTSHSLIKLQNQLEEKAFFTAIVTKPDSVGVILMSSSCPPTWPHGAQQLTREKAADTSPVLPRNYQAFSALQDIATGCLYDSHDEETFYKQDSWKCKD